MPVVIVGLSHRTAPVAVRERFAFPDARIPEILQKLRQNGLADEAVLISTCNRVELYAASERPAPETILALEQFLCVCQEYPEPADGIFYDWEEPHSLEHLFRVAAGLDSMVLGETEILGQLKRGYDLALQHQQTGRRLNKAFQKAFQTAKHIRSETQIQRGNVSVANVAVDLAERIFSTLSGRRVLVIGAGDTGEKTARALLSRGASHLIVSNRTWERAEAVAAALGGQAVPFQQWEQVFDDIDIVISSAASPDYLLDCARLEPLLRRRKHRPLLLVDLAVPRNIAPEVQSLSGLYLYNIDGLQATANEALNQRRTEIAKCEQIIHDRVRQLLASPPWTGFPVALSGAASPPATS